MHCANLDALVNVTNPLQQSSQQMTLSMSKNIIETKEEEDSRMLRMVVDISVLVLEGRLPECTSKRGYVEGPHCVLYPHMQAHRCDFNNYMCRRIEKQSQLIRSIWNEYKGLCIELRVCADCICGEEQVRKNTISRFDYVLEQWYVETTSDRNDDEGIGVMNWYGLLQAIRSQIHFSQLSAWWSSNRAQIPKNITYHILPLTQTDVNSCVLQHKFPVLAFSTTYLQVKVRSQPRTELLPKIHCPVHCIQDDVVDDRMKIHCNRLGKHHCQALVDIDENENESWFNDDLLCDRIFITGGSTDGKPSGTHDYTPVNSVKKARTRNRDPVTDCLLKLNQSECCRTGPRCLTFQRSPSNLSSRAFCVSSSKNIINSTSPSETSDLEILGDLKKPWESTITCNNDHNYSTSANILKQETSTQLLNICNWKNSVMSDVMCRVRNSASLMSILPESNVLAELFKPINEQVKPHEAAMATISNCCHYDEYIVDDQNSNINEKIRKTNFVNVDKLSTFVRYTALKDQNVKLQDNSDFQLIQTVVTATDAGDRCSKINHNKYRSNNCDFKGDYLPKGMEMHVKEKRQLKVSNKPIINLVHDRKIEKLKNDSKNRFLFQKQKKRLLPLAGNVIESVFSGRVHFTRIVENFKMKVTTGALFNGQNSGIELPAASYYYHFGDGDLSKSYLVKSFIPELEKGLQIPSSGQLQVRVFNTEDSLIKVFIVPYDLSDMPRCTKTYIRHKNYYTPSDTVAESIEWLQSFLQIKCLCSKSGRLYLQDEINAVIFQKSDLNTAYELAQKTDLKHHDVTEVAYK